MDSDLDCRLGAGVNALVAGSCRRHVQRLFRECLESTIENQQCSGRRLLEVSMVSRQIVLVRFHGTQTHISGS